MIRSLPVLLVAALAFPAGAQNIYRCTDASGGIVISTTRLDKSCRVVSSGSGGDSGGAMPRARSAGAAATPTPAGFPKVQEDTQRARDNERRHILEQELLVEQRGLDAARQALAEQERTPGVRADRLQPYQDGVAQHERNIQAIQKELGNLK